MYKGDVTLKDIAQAVGKSVATVSKALHNHTDISPETRLVVQEMAYQMGYRPNITAQRLQKQRTDSLALILPVLSSRRADPFFTELLAGLADESAAHQLDLLVSTCTPGEEERTTYQRLVNQRRVDGVIVAQPRLNDWRIDFLTKQNLPFICIGHFNPLIQAPGVWIDIAHGITLAVEHLIQQGRRHLALIPPPADLASAAICREAFQQAITAANQPEISTQIADTVASLEHKEGYRATQMLLNAAPLPDGLIACHDVLALGALASAQDQGFEIGNDIALIGFGDILLAEYAHPPLSTLHQPTYDMGRQACRILIEHLTNLNPSKPLKRCDIIKPWLVIRQSSALSLWV